MALDRFSAPARTSARIALAQLRILGQGVTDKVMPSAPVFLAPVNAFIGFFRDMERKPSGRRDAPERYIAP